MIAVGRGVNSECEVNHREGGALLLLLGALSGSGSLSC